MVKRSGWVKGAVVSQFLCGLLFLGTSIYVLVLARDPGVVHSDDGGAAVHGLKIAAAILTPLAVLVFAAAWGLKTNRLWGWWLALLIDVGLLAVFVYSIVDDGLRNIDWDMLWFTVVAFVLVLWLLVPAVRRFYWGTSQDGSAGDGLGVNPAGTKV